MPKKLLYQTFLNFSPSLNCLKDILHLLELHTFYLDSAIQLLSEMDTPPVDDMKTS